MILLRSLSLLFQEEFIGNILNKMASFYHFYLKNDFNGECLTNVFVILVQYFRIMLEIIPNMILERYLILFINHTMKLGKNGKKVSTKLCEYLNNQNQNGCIIMKNIML